MKDSFPVAQHSRRSGEVGGFALWARWGRGAADSQTRVGGCVTSQSSESKIWFVSFFISRKMRIPKCREHCLANPSGTS